MDRIGQCVTADFSRVQLISDELCLDYENVNGSTKKEEKGRSEVAFSMKVIPSSHSCLLVVQFHFTEIRSTGLLVDCKL